MNALTVSAASGSALAERVIIKGDLAGLSPPERMAYYQQVCNSLGLNPLTRPFEYITLNGKLTFYARKDATDQLRSIRNISTKILSRTIEDGVMVVHAGAFDKDGRQDEDLGAVFVGALKGEALANAIMKATTKAKRRVTLSICGLGWLDETEVADLPATVARQPEMDPETGEVPARDISEDRAEPANDEPAKLAGREASNGGKATLRAWSDALPREQRARLKPHIMRELMPVAEAVDKAAAAKAAAAPPAPNNAPAATPAPAKPSPPKPVAAEAAQTEDDLI